MRTQRKMSYKEKQAYTKGLLRGILISAAVIVAYQWGGKALNKANHYFENMHYASEHSKIKQLSGIIDERNANGKKYGIVNENDEYGLSLKRNLEYLKKRHEAEKKNIPCEHCRE